MDEVKQLERVVVGEERDARPPGLVALLERAGFRSPAPPRRARVGPLATEDRPAWSSRTSACRGSTASSRRARSSPSTMAGRVRDGFPQADIIERSVEAGAYAYLTKPFREADLVAAIVHAEARFGNAPGHAPSPIRSMRGARSPATRRARRDVIARSESISPADALERISQVSLRSGHTTATIAEAILEGSPMSRFRTPLYATEDPARALRSAAAATAGPLDQAAYARWLATRPPGRSRSRGIIVKRLGSWRGAIRSPGSTSPAAGPQRWTARPGGCTPPPGGRRTAGSTPTRSWRQALRAAAVVTEPPASLTRLDYDAYRATLRRRAVGGADHRSAVRRLAGGAGARRPGHPRTRPHRRHPHRRRPGRATVCGDAAGGPADAGSLRPVPRRGRPVLAAGSRDLERARHVARRARGRRHRAPRSSSRATQLLSALVATAAFTPDGRVTFAEYQSRARRGDRLP